MSYFSTWQQLIEDSSDQSAYNDFVQKYYLMESEAYDKILQEGKALLQGKALQMAEDLGFAGEMVVFAGFLDGIQSSLKTAVDLENFDDETEISLDIDFERLYWQMHEAKADWLYNLDSWDNVLCEERRNELAKEYRTSKIVRREKIGRNDPCPCGSGKKYKNCCARQQEARS